MWNGEPGELFRLNGKDECHLLKSLAAGVLISVRRLDVFRQSPWHAYEDSDQVSYQKDDLATTLEVKSPQTEFLTGMLRDLQRNIESELCYRIPRVC